MVARLADDDGATLPGGMSVDENKARELRRAIAEIEETIRQIEAAPSLVEAVKHTLRLGPLMDRAQAAEVALERGLSAAELRELAILSLQLASLAQRSKQAMERRRDAWKQTTN
ncbi:MAG: hypothetical protein JWM53_635 [bacterium]|nr:hypothetical protein [bacterium]